MLKVKDKLYKYSFGAGFMSYEVFEIREQENNTLYAVRCLNCKDHEPCELLVVNPKECKHQEFYEFVCMLNNNEEDNQYFWHDTEDKHYFWSEKNTAIKKEYESAIEYHIKEIEKNKTQIKQHENKINDMKVVIDNLILEKIEE